MDDVAALTHHLEYLFLKRIISGLRDKSIDIPKAKESAIAFLAIEPFTSSEDAHNKITEFVAKNKVFRDLLDYMYSYKIEKEDLEKVNKMREHIKLGNIDAALDVAKQ